jgi:predicted acylesterase/phospholipase RssA
MITAKTGLVLSAGGLYCAYQAGAWRAIEERLTVDLVTGASAGAMNGWPIAAGCSAELLISRWLDPESTDLLRLLPNPSLIRGFFDTSRLGLQAEKLVAEFQPRIPFGLALVELPRFRTVMFWHPHITARHLLATCSIPVVLPSVKIGGRRYIDGGVIEKLPISGAIEAGATRIIAIDALPKMDRWWLRAGNTFARTFRPKRHFPPEVEIITIAPSEPLGHTDTAVFWKRENLERWIDLGYRDACRVLDENGYSGTSK